MIIDLALASVLVVVTIFTHYEALRLISILLPKIELSVRLKILCTVAGCFVAHSIEVWLYALAYLVLERSGFGALKGQIEDRFSDYLYFSATSYSTLGFGDVYPVGSLRLIAGIEGLNGLFLIAWSTSFTYFVMNRLWPLHKDSDDI